MKVSVVIPIYNEEQYLFKCLRSLEKQIIKPDEIIIVNNNSTDQSIDIAKKFDTRILDEKKQGIIPARDRGYNSARFDIIARTDADTILPPFWIKRIITDFSRKKRVDAVSGPLEFYDFRLKTLPPIFTQYIRAVHTITDHYPLHGPNMAMTRDIWNAIKDNVCENETEVHEDIDTSIHIHQIGGHILYDRMLPVKISARRIKNDPISMFVEYPARVVKTIKKHYSLQKKINSKLTSFFS